MNPMAPPPSRPEELQRLAATLGVALPYRADFAPLTAPIEISGFSSENRMVALPMEGCDAEPDGSPSGLTYRRYHRIASGGYGIIWFEATAVAREGRSSDHALWLHEKTVARFADLVATIRETARAAGRQNVLCILQLTHAGRYARVDGRARPVVAHRVPALDQAQGLGADFPLVTDEKLDALQDDFVRTAQLAIAAGFDGVDMKCCHGYLVSSLLGAHRREGRYGGSYENRTRFVRETTRKLKNALPGIFLASRMNVWDGLDFPYGWGASCKKNGGPDLAEPKRLVQELAADGIALFGITIGLPRFDPHHNRPSSHYMGATKTDEHPLTGIARFIGISAAMQKAIPSTPVVSAGLAWLGGHMPHVAAGILSEGGATLAGFGRGIYATPNAPHDLSAGRPLKQPCTTCSKCSFLMKHGKPAGCVVRDSAVYLPAYQELVRAGKAFAPAPAGSRPRAVLLCEKPRNIDYVYGCGRREELARLVDLHPDVLNKSELLRQAEKFAGLKYIFTTWGMPVLTEEELSWFPELKAVFYAAGSVKFFAAPFLKKGVAVISAAETNGQPVAAFVASQILLGCKGYFRNTGDCRDAGKRIAGGCHSGPGIDRARVALISTGRITVQVIELLKPHELEIVAFNPYLSHAEADALGITKVSLEDAFRTADVISNHLPDIPETKRMLTAAHFSAMKPGAVFINTGRGAQIVEADLIRVFTGRTDLTALLDVTDPEPPQPDSPLYTLPNIHLTSHIAGSLGTEVVRMADTVMDDFKRMESKGAPRFAVTLEMLEKMA